MTAFYWSEEARAWRAIDGDAPEGFSNAEVGLYETLLTSASAYAMGLHADRIARSWRRLTGRPLAGEKVPSLRDARTEAMRRQWPGLRFEVLSFAGGRTAARIHRRDKPSMTAPVRLLPLAVDGADARYPHKSVDRQYLTQAYQRAVAAGADDALFVVGGEVRETAQAFVGLVTVNALVLPPVRHDVLPSTTRTATAEWCRTNARAVLERPITMDEVDGSALIYGNALIGLLPALLVGRAAVPLPVWFSATAIEALLVD